MKLPIETLAALYPQPVAVEGSKLLPLTVGGWAVLAACGIDPMEVRVRPECAYAAAAILSTGSFSRLPSSTEIATAAERIDTDPHALCRAVEAVFNQAFMTYVEAMPPPGEKPCVTPHGLGTPLELAEFLMGEYRMSRQEALDTPVASAFAFLAAACKRHGGKLKGFDYVEREYAKQLKDSRDGL